MCRLQPTAGADFGGQRLRSMRLAVNRAIRHQRDIAGVESRLMPWGHCLAKRIELLDPSRGLGATTSSTRSESKEARSRLSGRSM